MYLIPPYPHTLIRSSSFLACLLTRWCYTPPHARRRSPRAAVDLVWKNTCCPWHGVWHGRVWCDALALVVSAGVAGGGGLGGKEHGDRDRPVRATQRGMVQTAVQQLQCWSVGLLLYLIQPGVEWINPSSFVLVCVFLFFLRCTAGRGAFFWWPPANFCCDASQYRCRRVHIMCVCEKCTYGTWKLELRRE